MRSVFLTKTITDTEGDFRRQFGDHILMQRAAFGIATRIAQLLRHKCQRIVGTKVLLLVGSGDNGGDALFAGTYLLKRGVDVRAVLVSDTCHEIGNQKFQQSGGRFISRSEIQGFAADVVLDGIVGTGLRGALKPESADLVDFINQQQGLVVAIDIPSGVLADSGEVEGLVVEADVTLAVGALKVGLLTGAGSAHVGVLDVIDIGIKYPQEQAFARIIDLVDLLGVYPNPHHGSYKYSRGVVGLHVGSHEYPGAAFLAVGGALASGVGMVRIEGEMASDVLEQHPEVVLGLHDEHLTAFTIGSGGYGTCDDLNSLLDYGYPVVIDAHALSFISDESVQQKVKRRQKSGVMTLITPHEGEATRLGFSGTDRVKLAQKMAHDLSVTVVLKGPGTVITDPMGNTFIDVYGTSALATAGTGDVLAGLIAGTLARHDKPDIKVVAAAVAMHGLAGRRLLSNATASDLVSSLAQVRADLPDRQE